MDSGLRDGEKREKGKAQAYEKFEEASHDSSDCYDSNGAEYYENEDSDEYEPNDLNT